MLGEVVDKRNALVLSLLEEMCDCSFHHQRLCDVARIVLGTSRGTAKELNRLRVGLGKRVKEVQSNFLKQNSLH